MDKQLMRENYVVHLMNTGFMQASKSFSTLINRDVKITNTKSVLIRHDDDFSYITEDEGPLYLLITKIVGNLAGKSYFILNEKESDSICFMIGGTRERSQSMKDPILLELDNIISASVISQLSNSLKLSIYGDVPELCKMGSLDLQDFIVKDVREEDPSSIILTYTTFQFEGHHEVHPQFIWKLSSKIFDAVPSVNLYKNPVLG